MEEWIISNGTSPLLYASTYNDSPHLQVRFFPYGATKGGLPVVWVLLVFLWSSIGEILAQCFPLLHP